MIVLEKQAVEVLNVKEDKPPKHKFEYLDGYRGLLAMMIVISHCRQYKCPVILYISSLSQSFSITGFFVLSSFLLTYRLLKDFHNPKKFILTSILQYFIRRFFRIYVVFAVYATILVYLLKYTSEVNYKKFAPLSSILSLQYAGDNHLWTIAPEIKYYFLIPVFCLAFYLMKSLAPLLFIACIAWTTYDQMYNFFGISAHDAMSIDRPYILKNNFAVFFAGTQLAMAYYMAEKSDNFMKFVKREWIRIGLNCLSILIALYELRVFNQLYYKYDYIFFKSRSAILLSIVLFLMLLGDSSTNFIARLFEFGLLKKCGTYSFGIYLLHVAAIELVRYFHFIVAYKLTVISSLFLSYLLGYVFYHFFEKYWIDFANYLCAKLDSYFLPK